MATAETLATMFNRSNAIGCDWADGTGKDEFDTWLDQYEVDYSVARAIIAAVAGNCPYPRYDCCGSDAHPDHWPTNVDRAESDCGGGSEGVDWYDIGRAIVGIATSGQAWVVPSDEDVPDVTITRNKASDEQEPEEPTPPHVTCARCGRELDAWETGCECDVTD